MLEFLSEAKAQSNSLSIFGLCKPSVALAAGTGDTSNRTMRIECILFMQVSGLKIATFGLFRWSLLKSSTNKAGQNVKITNKRHSVAKLQNDD
jgi:hypothetical protein